MRKKIKKGSQNSIQRGMAFATVLLCGALFAGCGAKTADIEIQKGMQAVADMDYEEAMACFSAAENNGEDARLIARGRGIASIGQTNYEDAVTYLEDCLALSDGVVEKMDVDVNLYLATAYQKIGNNEKAKEIYDAILELYPNHTDAAYLRGYVELVLNNYQGARADFDRVIRLEPENYDRLIHVYEVLRDNGYREWGEEYLSQALTERSAKMSAFDRGRINYYLENYETAQLDLEEAKNAAPGDSGVYLYLGMAYEATGDYNYAITNVYTAYLTQKDGTAELYNQLGLCYLKQEQYAPALDAFQKAMQIPDNGMMQTLSFNEIVAYEYLGNYNQAAALLQNYLAIYPDDETAKREYGFLSTR